MTQSEPDARPAGIVSRGVAAVIDLIVVLLVIAVIYVGMILARLVYSPAAFRLPNVDAVFSTVVTFAVAVLYLTACWAVSGRTVGHVTMGLRVVGRRSLRVHALIAFLRAVTCVLFPIGLAWVALDSRRRSLQDIVFHTCVVYVRPE